jgi:PAS domain S-box-containing protein
MICTIDQQGCFLFVNEASSSLLGYDSQELLGHSFIDFVDPRDRSATREALQTIAQGDKTINFENCYLHKEGREKFLLWSAAWSEEDKIFFCVARDITEQKLIRQKLQEERELHKALVEYGSDTIALLDTAGNYQYVSGSISRTLGYEPQQLIGKNAFAQVHPGDLDKVKESWSQIKGREHVQISDYRFRKADGQWIWFETIVSNQLHNPAIKALVVNARNITERKLSSFALVESQQRFRSLFQDNPDMVLIENPQGLIVDINPAGEVFKNRTRAEVLHRHFSEFLPAETVPTFERYLQAALRGQTQKFEIAVNYGPQHSKTLEVTKIPIPVNGRIIGVHTIARDITEKVKSRQELEKLSLVASKTTNGVIIMDAQGRTEWVNESFTHITGYTLAEVLNQYPGTLLQGADTEPATSKSIKAKISQGLSFSEEILNYKKNGEKLWISLDMTPVRNDANEITRYIAIQTDITFRKEAQEAQERLTQDLFRQNRDLQQFTYIVSHNLRAPVANALGLADLLTQMDKCSDMFDQALANLKTSTGNLDTVLKDLNQILSIRDNEESIEKEKVDLRLVYEQAAASLQHSWQACQGQAIVDIAAGTFVAGSKAYFYSIFYNLLSNAIRYRAADRPLQVQVSCQQHPVQGTTLRFTDNGAGFDAVKAGDQIFKLYKRFHKNSEGRGVGLFLVKTQVEAMGGHIRVASQPNQGTTFTIIFPWRNQD